jgi:hypothetical protein
MVAGTRKCSERSGQPVCGAIMSYHELCPSNHPAMTRFPCRGGVSCCGRPCCSSSLEWQIRAPRAPHGRAEEVWGGKGRAK